MQHSGDKPLTQFEIDHGSISQVHRRGFAWWLGRLTIAALLLVFSLFFVTMLRIFLAARADDTGPAGAIVVLGAAQFNGVPSRVFQARLDTAFDLYLSGASDVIVVTGGKLPGDVFTEGEAGRNYLIDRGVPADAILMEYMSSNTEESLRRVSAMLHEREIDDVLLVSDGFHLYRSRMLAEEFGLRAGINDADNSPIRQGSTTEFRYIVRETFAVLAHRLGLD